MDIITDPTPCPSPTREGSVYGVPSAEDGDSRSPPCRRLPPPPLERGLGGGARGWGWGQYLNHTKIFFGDNIAVGTFATSKEE